MNKIQLIDTLPNVFLSRSDIMSDIWQQKVTFEKGGLYLVEANSGTGKSSLCSYIFGYRHCLLYTSPSPRHRHKSRMPSSA